MKPVKAVHFCYDNGVLYVLDDQGRLWQKSFEWKQVELPEEKEEFTEKIKIIKRKKVQI